MSALELSLFHGSALYKSIFTYSRFTYLRLNCQFLPWAQIPGWTGRREPSTF